MLFQFNAYSSLLIPFVIQGFIVGILLLFRSKKSNRIAHLFLGLLLFLYTLRVCQWMLGFGGWYDVRDWHTTFMFYMPFHHWLAIGPLIYFYFRSVTNTNFTFTKKDWLHFIPECLWLLRFLFIFFMDIVLNHWMKGEPLPYFDQTHGYYHENGIGIPGPFWTALEYISVFTYLILTLRLFRKYQSYIRNEFADTEQIDFTWIRNFLIANLIGHIVWFVFDLADLLTGEEWTYVQDWYSFFFLGVIIYYLSISGYSIRLPARVEANLHFEPENPIHAIQVSSDIEEDAIQQLTEKLRNYITTEKPYLNPEINLTRLSKDLNTTPGSLSRVINSQMGMNFNDFINRYRVNEVKNRLQRPEATHLSLLAIALDSGFNSKATFNRAFKKHAGESPSIYLKRIQGLI